MIKLVNKTIDPNQTSAESLVDNQIHLGVLPDELIVQILENLSLADLFQARCVDKQFHRCASEIPKKISHNVKNLSLLLNQLKNELFLPLAAFDTLSHLEKKFQNLALEKIEPETFLSLKHLIFSLLKILSLSNMVLLKNFIDENLNILNKHLTCLKIEVDLEEKFKDHLKFLKHFEDLRKAIENKPIGIQKAIDWRQNENDFSLFIPCFIRLILGVFHFENRMQLFQNLRCALINHDENRKVKLSSSNYDLVDTNFINEWGKKYPHHYAKILSEFQLIDNELLSSMSAQEGTSDRLKDENKPKTQEEIDEYTDCLNHALKFFIPT